MDTNDRHTTTYSSSDSRTASDSPSSRRTPSEERGNPVLVDLDLLVQHPRAVRIANQDEVIAGLAAQMKLMGYYEKRFAITVRKRRDGRLELISGWHRAEAARLVGINQVWTFIVEMTDRETYMALALANTQEPLSKLEIGLFGNQVESDNSESVTSLGRKLGIKPQNLARYKKGARVFTSVRALLGTDDIIRLRDKAEHLARVADAPQDKWVELVKQLLAAETQDPTATFTIKATEDAVEALTAPPSGETPLEATDGPSVGPPEAETGSHKSETKAVSPKKSHGKESAHGKEGAVEVSLAIGGDATKLSIDGKLVRVRVTRIEIPRDILERALKESASDGSSEVNGIPTVSVDAHLLHLTPTVSSGTVTLEVL